MQTIPLMAGRTIMRKTITAAAAAVAVAFVLSPAVARSCDDGNPCAGQQAAAPMKLDQFMSTWKPVAHSKHRKKSSHVVHRKEHQPRAIEEAKAAEPTPAEATPAPVPAPTPAPVDIAAAAPEQPVATPEVPVASFNEVNEIDAAVDPVKVVAANEVNDIDLAAPPAPPPAETVAQAVPADEPAPADHSWVGKLLLAAAGAIGLAGATRLLLA
jgi:hypothetical protein